MAIIKERGTIAVLGEVQSGTSQQGNPWYRQTIVVDVAGFNGSYRKVALQASGNLVQDLEGAMIGDKVEISYQVTAREWNGKWFNNVDLYKVEFLEPAMPQMQQPVAPAYPQNPRFPQYPQQPQPQVNPQMYPQTPAPAAPAAPAPRRGRPAVQSTPQIPANTPMDLQQDDLPPAFYQ
jgi:hypothetical protein